MDKIKKFENFVNEKRMDRIGSTVTFLDDRDQSEVKAKVVDRKDDGRVTVLCKSGRNKGNTKNINPEQIIDSSCMC